MLNGYYMNKKINDYYLLRSKQNKSIKYRLNYLKKREDMIDNHKNRITEFIAQVR